MSLVSLGEQITIYGGCILIVFGVLGEIFNVIVLLSLKTFRQCPSGFYLTLMSFVNIGQLLFGLLSRVIIFGFEVDWNATSIVFCKFRLAFFLLCALVSYTCLCLAIIDQYLATSTRPHWQQWCNNKIAYRLVLLFTFIWIGHLIPYPIMLQHVISSTTNKVTCTSTNPSMVIYRSYYIGLFLTGYLPDIITLVFGILAYRNIRQIGYRTIPLVRRELDKQLTVMVFAQVIINFLTNVPFSTLFAITFVTANWKDTFALTVIQFTYNVSIIIFYTYFSSSFYIYMCVSERFRRQFIHVIYQIYSQRWRQKLKPNNQIAPY
ncbi:unnamed protein product [Adineta ricciae]|uniref:G-protein coupled receptors family 1 profile domain-containing protein n=1 Tax=Adineta ricciae TaxID=249248 RepID=A0A815HUP3_ADIRI|nr:unnamed protein product [Adineta ricciae]CAF1441479.1 unnamed protein product [Adineta ricciae]